MLPTMSSGDIRTYSSVFSHWCVDWLLLLCTCTLLSVLAKRIPLSLQMLSNNMPQLASADDIQYVKDALMSDRTDNEATYAFTKFVDKFHDIMLAFVYKIMYYCVVCRHIEASVGSLATQINFFIHNIAQMKFSSGGGCTGLLSITPNTYSIAADGKITHTCVSTFHKKFYPETYYVSSVSAW